MSDQLTSQSRPSSGISRRTALRGAAWSASAVTVVVAVPAYAATSGKSGSAKGSISRDGAKIITGSVTFTNTSAIAYNLIVVVIGKVGSTTLTPVAVAANSEVTFPVSAELGSNDNGQTVTLACYHDSIAEAHRLGSLVFTSVNKNSTGIKGTWAPPAP